MMSACISVEGLSKAYRIGAQAEVHDTLTAAVKAMACAPVRNFRKLRSLDTYASRAKASRREAKAVADETVFWALKDVSFQVGEGEVLGIIGRNGAGKSTLLKVLSRITEPTAGRAVIRGRVSSLLEVGTGFHPELSGRDNVYMNGTILGMTKREIDRKFDEIVDFSGVEEFLDTPVKRYSSGMQVRLAFAVAAHLDPEILIVDEVLAVGDAEFQKKCIGKMQDVAQGGRTVLFVSHNMAAMTYFCDRAIVLSRGQICFEGLSQQAVEMYANSLRAGSRGNSRDLDAYRESWCEKVITWARVVDERTEIALGSGLTIEIGFDCRQRKPLRSPVMSVVFHRLGSGIVGSASTSITGFDVDAQACAVGRYRCTVPKMPFIQGRYQVDVWLSDGTDDVDALKQYISFEILPSDYYGSGRLPRVDQGTALLDVVWDFQPDLA